MHISKARLQNFRCFRDQEVRFQPGLNVVIGENNAGKTALFTGLRLVLDRGEQRSGLHLSVHDVHHEALRSDEPPQIVITLTIQVEQDDDAEDKAAVASWLTKFEYPWEAELSFVYELATEEARTEYKNLRSEHGGTEIERSTYAFEVLLAKGEFEGELYGGSLGNRYKADPQQRKHFACRYLDAIRDAESDLHSGKAPLMRRMLREILDPEPHPADLPDTKAKFRGHRDDLIRNLKGRIDEQSLFKLAADIWGEGATAAPDLFGRLNEHDLMESLALFLDYAVHKHPVSHNGLGYNNLLYVALVLASLGIPERRGKVSPAFPVLMIEEPEAHLHPALQYRFLVFLREQLDPDPETGKRASRQVLLSSHSTQVTAAVDLDSIVCLYRHEGAPYVAYPGRVFPLTKDGQASKAYVERFLDATKSSVLFARAVIMVEGIAEQVLLPGLVDLAYQSKKAWLDRNYVAVVRVDGVTFKHFLPLFGIATESDLAPLGLCHRPIACITDGDPQRTLPGADKATKCWPYDAAKELSASARKLQGMASPEAPQLHVAVADKTFEYDIAYANPHAAGLLTSAMATKKRETLLSLMEKKATAFDSEFMTWWPDDVAELRTYAEQDPADLDACAVATYYLRCCEEAKGEHASHLSAAFSGGEDLVLPTKLPPYIEGALRHVCTFEPLPEA